MDFDQKLINAHRAAEVAWARSNGAHPRPRGPLIGVRIPPRSNAAEIVVVVNDHNAGEGLVFFAGDAPAQIYACSASKCHIRGVRSGGVSVPVYQIVDSKEDLALPNKSALRAIACNIAPNNTNVDARRMFAAHTVAPEVRSAFTGT